MKLTQAQTLNLMDQLRRAPDWRTAKRLIHDLLICEKPPEVPVSDAIAQAMSADYPDNPLPSVPPLAS